MTMTFLKSTGQLLRFNWGFFIIRFTVYIFGKNTKETFFFFFHCIILRVHNISFSYYWLTDHVVMVVSPSYCSPCNWYCVDSSSCANILFFIIFLAATEDSCLKQLLRRLSTGDFLIPSSTSTFIRKNFHFLHLFIHLFISVWTHNHILYRL